MLYALIMNVCVNINTGVRCDDYAIDYAMSFRDCVRELIITRDTIHNRDIVNSRAHARIHVSYSCNATTH